MESLDRRVHVAILDSRETQDQLDSVEYLEGLAGMVSQVDVATKESQAAADIRVWSVTRERRGRQA